MRVLHVGAIPFNIMRACCSNASVGASSYVIICSNAWYVSLIVLHLSPLATTHACAGVSTLQRLHQAALVLHMTFGG
jgi:hypothetical protein